MIKKIALVSFAMLLFTIQTTFSSASFIPCYICVIDQDTTCLRCLQLFCASDAGRSGCHPTDCITCDLSGVACQGPVQTCLTESGEIKQPYKVSTQATEPITIGSLKISAHDLLEIAQVNPRFALVNRQFIAGNELSSYHHISTSNFEVTVDDVKTLFTESEESSAYKAVMNKVLAANTAIRDKKLPFAVYIRTTELKSPNSAVTHLSVVTPGVNDPGHTSMTWYLEKNTTSGIWELKKWRIS